MRTDHTVIYKYEIPYKGRSLVQLPKGSIILSVGLQPHPEHKTNSLYLWALVPLESLSNSKMENRVIKVIGTGNVNLEGEHHFIGTAIDEKSRLVWHVFEEVVIHEPEVIAEPKAEPEFEWVTPTDEDAKLRPEVEVKDYDNNEWKSGILIRVRCKDKNEYSFVVERQNGLISVFCQCRMKKLKSKATPDKPLPLQPSNPVQW